VSADLGPVLKAAYPKVVATLTRVLGDMDRAMDATQDALVKALQTWQIDGVPANPVAWLVTVGRNRAIDQLRREAKAVSMDSNVVPIAAEFQSVEFKIDDESLSELEDDLLRLVFTCCHPVLTPMAQITLVLKVVLGLSVEEIARALLTSRANIEKRITRAKRKLAEANVGFATPAGPDIALRINAVLKAIYLLFNEGYSRIFDTNLVRNSLIDEAIRLARMTCRAVRHDSEARSLLALMILSAARLGARVDQAGVFVPLHQQDRKLWDTAMIREGVALIDSVYAARHPPGAYQIQAAISAIHSQAASQQSTDWLQIVALYEKLQEYDSSPVIPVNLAVALAFAGRDREALARLEQLRANDLLENYQPLQAALAFVYERCKQWESAADAYRHAIALSTSSAQRVYLEQQLAAIQRQP
jgi:RNA polymerase sigma-70 factor (ECF subfamily)